MRISFLLKTLISLSVVAMWMVSPPVCHAGAKKISRGIFDVDGYRVDASAHHRGDDICLRGRITYGADCEQLRMRFKLKNQVGHAQTVTTVVEDVGGSGSRTIREDAKCKKDTRKVRPKWAIEDINVTCLD